MSNTLRYGFPLPTPDGYTLHQQDYAHLFKIVDAQVPGALECIGEGVLYGLVVTATGGRNLQVGTGAGNCQHPTHSFVFLEQKNPGTLAIPLESGDGEFFIFGGVRIASTPGGLDSREDRAPLLLIDDTDVLPGALLLAQVTVTGGIVTNVVDRRSPLGSSGILDDLLGNGRIAGANVLSGAPEPIVPADLAVLLLEESIWRIGGKRLKLGHDVVIDTVPASFTGYGFVSIDEETGEPTVKEEHWFAIYPTGQTLAALRASGYPCLGKVTSNATQVTAVDATANTGRADLIYTQAALLALMAGGGDEEPLPDFATEQYVDDAIAALRAELLAAIANGGRRPMITRLDQLVTEHAVTRQMAIRLGTLSPVTENDAERSQSANVVGRADGSIYGDGSGSHPDHLDTELTVNLDGTIEP